MTDTEDDSWPEGYHEDCRKHFHALGVVSARWAHAEGCLHQLAREVLGHEHADIILRHLGNVALGTMLGELVAATETNAHAKAAVAHALKMYDACRQNRNDLAHAIVHIESNAEALRLLKRPDQRRATERRFSVDLKTIRRVADDIYRMEGLIVCLFATYLCRKKSERLFRQFAAVLELPPIPRRLE
jgi:hypothetical protein